MEAFISFSCGFRRGNGRIEIGKSEFTGKQAIFQAILNEGYQIKGLPMVNTIAGSNEAVEVTQTGNPNEYSFIMPGMGVQVTAAFGLIPSSEPTPEPSVDPNRGGSNPSSKNGRSVCRRNRLYVVRRSSGRRNFGLQEEEVRKCAEKR